MFVRAAEPLGFSQGLWQRAAAIGLPGMCLPDEVGGGGSDLLDTALVVEELGRARRLVRHPGRPQ